MPDITAPFVNSYGENRKWVIWDTAQRSHGNRYVQWVPALARQGQGEATVAPEIESTVDLACGAGKLSTRSYDAMEWAFGADFSSVRIHARLRGPLAQ